MTTTDAIELFERKLIRYCAPVMASLKPAAMFSCHFKCADCCGNPDCSSLTPLGFLCAYQSCRARLASCGVSMTVLAERERSVLLLVYRIDLLSEALTGRRQAAFLESYGYAPADTSACLSQLARRIRRCDRQARAERGCAFPHEVGIFLGYPYEDVVGFIENEGRGALATGCWKVYSQERDAAECFCRFEECTRRCTRAYEQGATLEELAERMSAASVTLAA